MRVRDGEVGHIGASQHDAADHAAREQTVVGSAETVSLEPCPGSCALVARLAEAVKEDEQRYSLGHREVRRHREHEAPALGAFDVDLPHVEPVGLPRGVHVGVRAAWQSACRPNGEQVAAGDHGRSLLRAPRSTRAFSELRLSARR